MLNIFLLGLVSFFSDLSSEMVYPLIPLYLTSAFGATPVLVGVIEGIAESVASLLKVFSGYITDRYKRKKPIAFMGYATGLIYKLALILASSWAGILVSRVIDRIGKGIRTAPRDVLVGLAFGLHKALDMAGSAAGILCAYLLISGLHDGIDYKKIFLISALPMIAALVCFFFIKDKHETRKPQTAREPFWKNLKLVSGNLRLYLLVSFIFTLGNSSNTFLLLRARDVGFSDTNVVLLYLVYNLTAAVLSVPFGRISDKIGRKAVLVAGYLIFSLVYFGFAFVQSSALLVVTFVVYGFYTALVTGAERAMISEISPKELKGTMLGLQSTIVGLALLPASVIAGILWDKVGAAAPFVFGACLSLVAAIMLIAFLGKTAPGKETQNETI